MMNGDGKVLGIDVSKEWVDAFLFPSEQSWHVDRTWDALHAWVKTLPTGISLAVMEGSGGLEQLPGAILAGAGIPVSVVNPRQVRGYVEAHGRKAKTDSIDARYIAQFGSHVRPTPQPVSSKEQNRLEELMTRRSQLVKMRTSEKNRLSSARGPRVQESIRSHLQWIEKELGVIDDELDTLIKNNPIRQTTERIITSIPGVGTLTARAIQADLPEIGTPNRKEIAALAGVAPFTHQSGKWKGRSFIIGGRSNVRSVLYMAAISAVRWNPVIRNLYERLIQKGKPFKVVITACMRKLLTIINAMVRDQKMWCPTHITS